MDEARRRRRDELGAKLDAGIHELTQVARSRNVSPPFLMLIDGT